MLFTNTPSNFLLLNVYGNSVSFRGKTLDVARLSGVFNLAGFRTLDLHPLMVASIQSVNANFDGVDSFLLNRYHN